LCKIYISIAPDYDILGQILRLKRAGEVEVEGEVVLQVVTPGPATMSAFTQRFIYE
jgi:hypothetical protein